MCEEGKLDHPGCLVGGTTPVGSCILTFLLLFSISFMSDCPPGFNRNPNSSSRSGYVI